MNKSNTTQWDKEAGNQPLQPSRTFLNALDLHTGIGGFHVAAKRNGKINTFMCSEIDPFNNKLIDSKLNLDNAGDICSFALSEQFHPDSARIANEDIVPCEESGLSSVTFEDFMEGVLPFPDIATSGFPCQNITPANLLDDSGIDGQQSGLIRENLRIIEDLEIPYVVLETSERLNRKGLSYILAEFDRMGYIVEWETISAVAFGFPHYRHRLYLVAYLKDTKVAKTKSRVFDTVRRAAHYFDEKPFRFPLLSESPSWVISNAVVENTRSIKLRTKRINGLGNAVIPEIPFHIFNGITLAEFGEENSAYKVGKKHLMPVSLTVEGNQIIDSSGKSPTHMPTRGYMEDGAIYSDGNRCALLNSTKTAYAGLYSTLIRKDGNNNFTTKSRLNRPGKLGGLVGEIMSLGVDQGGLHPEFCEQFMGYERGYTEL